MGFAFKTPKITSPATPAATPQVVTETVQEDTSRGYDQKRSNRRGVLSTILSDHNRGGVLSSTTPTGNSTLG